MPSRRIQQEQEGIASCSAKVLKMALHNAVGSQVGWSFAGFDAVEDEEALVFAGTKSCWPLASWVCADADEKVVILPLVNAKTRRRRSKTEAQASFALVNAFIGVPDLWLSHKMYPPVTELQFALKTP